MRHGTTKPFQLAAACVLSAVIAGCTIIAPPGPNHKDPGNNQTAPAGKTTKPKASTSPVTAHAISPFVSLSNYLAGRQGKITAAVYDKRTGRTRLPPSRAGHACRTSVVVIGGWPDSPSAGTSVSSNDQR